MGQIRVLLGFANAPDHELEETAGAVIEGLTGNAAYPTPPVTMAALQAAVTAFVQAVAAQAQGGSAATAEKENKREALIALLRQLALYVQGACGNDLATLLSSGFDAVSTNRAQSPLEKPAIREIENGISGQLVLRVSTVRNARCYEARYATVTAGQQGAWQTAGLFTQARQMAVSGLTPGVMYAFTVRAVGGSTGYSDWSDTLSHMSM